MSANRREIECSENGRLSARIDMPAWGDLLEGSLELRAVTFDLGRQRERGFTYLLGNSINLIQQPEPLIYAPREVRLALPVGWLRSEDSCSGSID